MSPPGHKAKPSVERRLQGHSWSLEVHLHIGRRAYQHAGGQVGAAQMQRAHAGYWVCPSRPTLHPALCPGGWPEAAKMGSLFLWLPAGFGLWKVLAPEQRAGLYLQLLPPAPCSPLPLAQATLSPLSWTLSFSHFFSSPFIKLSPATSICFLPGPQLIQSHVGQSC